MYFIDREIVGHKACSKTDRMVVGLDRRDAVGLEEFRALQQAAVALLADEVVDERLAVQLLDLVLAALRRVTTSNAKNRR